MGRKKISEEEKKKRHRERSKNRREMIKNDPERAVMERLKQHNRYEARKEKGAFKLINELTPREQRHRRQNWRNNTKRYRSKKEFLQKLQANTPPDSDAENNHLGNVPEGTADGNLNNEITPTSSRLPNNCSSSSKTPAPGPSRQKAGGRKIMYGKRAKCYRNLKIIAAENQRLRTQLERYKKRYYRKKQKKTSENSPNTKINTLLQGVQVPQIVRRKLLFGEVLNEELSTNFKNLKDHKSKQIFTKVISGKLLRKYRFLQTASSFLSYSLYRSHKNNSNMMCFNRKKKAEFIKLKTHIQKFFLDDDNSKVCPGKNDTVTRLGVKKQKRYLNNSLKVLHNTFKKKNNSNVSYALFCKLRPFWVVFPKVSARDTCLCITHENMNLLISALNRNKIIPQKNWYEVLSQICCSSDSTQCLKRECSECKTQKLMFSLTDGQKTKELSYQQWKTRKEKRISAKTKKEITVQRTVKETLEATSYELVCEINQEYLPTFLYHTLNIVHQSSEMKKLKRTLKKNELFFHIDYSENYLCKYACEPQSVHFGASREQITLHTGVLYYMEQKEGFCTVSACLRHDAAAVLAHICPVIEHYQTKHDIDNIDTLHFLSDSPSTQYRNKKMFYYIQTYLPILFPNIKQISWNYSEAGHGKGAPDGIGAAVKRCADRLVEFNTDIDTFDKFSQKVTENLPNIYICVIEEQDIQKCEEVLPKNIPCCVGTIKTHQVTWNRTNNKIILNSLTCYKCSIGEKCTHNFILEVNLFPKGIPRLNDHNNDLEVNLSPEDIPKINDHNDLKVNMWIAAIYDDKWYPGIIEQISENNMTVNFMARSGNRYYWPLTTDCQQLGVNEILCVLKEPPVPVSSRLFQVPTFQEIDQKLNLVLKTNIFD